MNGLVGYDAHYCRGQCSFPLGQNQRPTNHATVQSIVSQLQLVDGVRQPCCVPNRLLSLTLLYYDDHEDSKILVADFGLSEYEWELKEGSPVCGTPGYLSPEVIARQPCTTAADVWSIGVIAYILLAGYPPFYANPDEPDTEETLFKKILTGDFKFHENSWSHISPDARDFIRCLLCPDPLQRPTADEALSHPWLNDVCRNAILHKQSFFFFFLQAKET